MFLWGNIPERWVELDAGFQFAAQAKVQLALDKEVFTGIWEQAGVLLLGAPNDDRTAPGQGHCIVEISQEAWEGSGEVIFLSILLTN